MDRRLRPTRGWAILWGFVIAHNLWAIATGREMLSERARQVACRHPLLVPLGGLTLWAHLMGYLGPYDPIHWIGSAADKAGGRSGG